MTLHVMHLHFPVHSSILATIYHKYHIRHSLHEERKSQVVQIMHMYCLIAYMSRKKVSYHDRGQRFFEESFAILAQVPLCPISLSFTKFLYTQLKKEPVIYLTNG